MRIIIDASSAKMGGAVTYLTNILKRLPPPESGYEFVVYLPAETAQKQSGLGPNVRLVPISSRRGAWWKSIWWQQVTLRALVKSQRADLLYCTGNFAMLHSPVRQLLLVCNALYFSKLYQQEALARHSRRFQIEFKLRRWLICESVRQADVLITPTESTLEELSQLADVLPERKIVSPYGAVLPSASSSGSLKTEPEQRHERDSAVRLVYVSLYSEHKNLSTLLKAMPLLNTGGMPKFRLVTTADPGWKGAAWTVTHKEDLALARQPDVAPWVKFLNPLPNGEAEKIYSEGDIFVFPSWCESFGLPMLEAMGHGLPIVAADTPVSREVCGEAALYFRPLDSNDLAEKVRLLGRDEALREKFGAAGRCRAASFRWENHVERILGAAEGLASQQSKVA